ncbi:MAG: hypothetical protein F4Y04_01465 [Chloroflexi bacterium]|nr:hypothetical protein [Chloroflexota bacterium]
MAHLPGWLTARYGSAPVVAVAGYGPWLLGVGPPCPAGVEFWAAEFTAPAALLAAPVAAAAAAAPAGPPAAPPAINPNARPERTIEPGRDMPK